MLTVYNTLSRSKEIFQPIAPPKVGMYVCGMTIYDYCHAGHARMMMAFDVIQRWLRASGYEVTFVRNITDIDDKIIKRAVENGETIGELTERMVAAMNEDLGALGVLQPDVEPRATRYVPQMLALIGTLEERGLAYQAQPADGSTGDVNFAVRRFPGYGKLSGKSLDDLRAGERIAVDSSKQDPLDFVLWKSAKPEEPKEAKWSSRWGDGRPGWHIECSAMSAAILGENFDIHGGGTDLQFPHHENEIAQSEGGMSADHVGQPFVRYWLHNGFLNVDNEKMSKSLGNFFTIREVLATLAERYGSHLKAAEVLRYFLVRTHYRSPFNYSDANLEDARGALTRLYTALHKVPAVSLSIDWADPFAARFKAAMDDDFNTPEAISVLFDLAGEVNRSQSSVSAGLLRALGAVLGILQNDAASFLQGGSSEGDAAILAAIEERAAAKKARDFGRADAIRKALLAQGIVLEDKPGGATEWRRS